MINDVFKTKNYPDHITTVNGKRVRRDVQMRPRNHCFFFRILIISMSSDVNPLLNYRRYTYTGTAVVYFIINNSLSMRTS